MKAESGKREAESSGSNDAWSHRRRVIITLGASLGCAACVCLRGGVVARGVVELNNGLFCVGGEEFFCSAVGAITLEPHLVTIHLGDIA